jgi:hypothetical protein
LKIQTGVEFYAGLDSARVQFYYDKLQTFLTNRKIVKVSTNAPNTRNHSIYINSSKKKNGDSNLLQINANEVAKKLKIYNKQQFSRDIIKRRKYGGKISLFFESLNIATIVKEIINKFEMNLNNSISLVENDINKQKHHFVQKKKLKRRKSVLIYYTI